MSEPIQNIQPLKWKGREKEYNREYQRIYMGRKIECKVCRKMVCYAGMNYHKMTAKHLLNALMVLRDKGEPCDEQKTF